jgi:hypothetical protein
MRCTFFVPRSTFGALDNRFRKTTPRQQEASSKTMGGNARGPAGKAPMPQFPAKHHAT